MPLDSRPVPSRSTSGLRLVASRRLGGAPEPTPPTTSCNCEFTRAGDSGGVVAHFALPHVVHSVIPRTHQADAGDHLGDLGVSAVDTRPLMTSIHNLWNRCSQRCAQAALRAIEWYQDQRATAVSPCRFFPSCSEYSHEAISVHGFGRGLWLTARRLSRCRPFGPSGFDPVPEPCASSVHPHSKEHRHV
jgi:putative membrane protein insertion efficiency factor